MKIIIALVLILVLAAAGAGAYIWYGIQKPYQGFGIAGVFVHNSARRVEPRGRPHPGKERRDPLRCRV